MPAYEELQIGWLEEPFPAQDYRSYQTAASLGTTPLAAGENHYTRFEFTRLIEDGAVSFVQPDLSKTGGVTEAMRIAGMASAWKLSFNPHTSATGINMAATINVLASVDVPGYFEGDVAKTQSVPRRSRRRPLHARRRRMRQAVGNARAWRRDR